jgi:hypothetical protein
MRIEPARLNSAIAWLFMVGASCFALGAIPAYVRAVGADADAMTFFVGSIFFTSASYCQLVQVQSPGMTGVDEQRQHARIRARLWAWRPRDKNWLAAATQFPGTLFFNHSTLAATVHNLTAAEADKHVWRPDFFGSVLFLVSSAYAISALGARLRRPQWRLLPWWIAWVNMLGSLAFMVSAIASFVVPSTNTLLDLTLANAGTFLGAVCFLVGAALMLPAWQASVRSKSFSGHPAR